MHACVLVCVLACMCIPLYTCDMLVLSWFVFISMHVGVCGMHARVQTHAYRSLPLVLSGWETANKYQIKNSLGQQVYFAAEGKDCCNGLQHLAAATCGHAY